MTIGIDCRLWNETGVGRYIRNLVANLVVIDKKNEYVLFTLWKDAQHVKSIIYPHQDVGAINPKWKIIVADIHWHSLVEQTKFLKILNKEQLDLMHFPYFSYPILYNHPFVITIHDLILFHYPTGKASHLPRILYEAKLLVYKQLMRHAAKHAKKIIAVSNATKKEIIDTLHAGKEKIVVTYEGFFDGSHFLNSKFQLKTKNPYFLYVGNAYPHKNLEKMLKAFREFSEIYKNVDLILVGKKDYFYGELRRNLYIFGIEKSVHILEHISDEELIFLYRHALALVMPSLMEGFGLPVLEAMANNCLVAASNIPSLKEICKDAAIYFDPRERSDIVKVLKKVYFEQTTLNAKKELGLQIAQSFSWRTMAEKTKEVYESCISI